MHRRGDHDSRVEEGRYLAEHIRGAHFIELSGADHRRGRNDTREGGSDAGSDADHSA